jgi:hypothetical protein
MIIFHSQQPDSARRARKNENASADNFTSQIASSICTVAFTKCEKSDATIFKSRCSRTSVNYRLMAWHALPLSFVRFFRLAISSPMIRRSPARRSRSVREPSGKTSGEMPRQFPHNFPAIVGQWQRQCRWMAGRMTRKTTCVCRMQTRHVRAENLRDDLPQISTMTFKNYEYTNRTNARS